MGANMRPETTKQHRCISHVTVQDLTRETHKHAETPSGLDLRLSMFFISGTMFALSKLKETVTEKYMKLIVFVTAQNQSIERHRADCPLEVQWGPKRDSKSTQWHQNDTGSSKMVLPKRVPLNALIC